MKRTATILFICIVLALLGAGYDMYMAKPVVRETISAQTTEATKPAPDFEFTDIGGQKHRLSDFRGKVVVIDFWASWCVPCVTSFPSLMRMAEHYAGDVVVIALSSDVKQKQITDFVARQKPEVQAIAGKHPVYLSLDTGLKITRNLFFVEKYPESLILTRDQGIYRKLVGETNWQSPENRAMLDGLVLSRSRSMHAK